MFFGRLSGFARTLRVRLLLWNTAVVLLIVFPTLIGVREWLSHTLRHEFDEILKEDILEVRLTLAQFDEGRVANPSSDRFHDAMERKAQGHANRHWFVQIFDGQGEVLWSSPNAPRIEAPESGSSPLLTTVAAGEESYRLAQARIDQTGQGPMTIRVGASLWDLDEDVALLTRTMVLVGGAIMVLAPLGGYWLAGRATKPLAHIIDTTAGLRPSNLDERLPTRGTGDELDRLSETINGFLNRIAAYLEQRRDYIANSAHELRSPLAAIRSSAEMALETPRPAEGNQATLADIVEECEHLERLVNRLLLLAEGDAGRLGLNPRPVRLDALVRKAMAMFQGVAEAHDVRLISTRLDATTVYGSEEYLRQVVQNLIDNAVKFTPPGGCVEVVVCANSSRHSALLRVADTGVGIAPDDLPRIFERFYRGDRSRQRGEETRGTGLGLSICQAVTAAIGGSILVESEIGKGSVFKVELPLATS